MSWVTSKSYVLVPMALVVGVSYCDETTHLSRQNDSIPVRFCIARNNHVPGRTDPVLNDPVRMGKKNKMNLCFSPYGSSTKNINNSFLQNFAKSNRLKIAGSWYKKPYLHCWTWYSNAEEVVNRKCIFVSTRRILYKYEVFGSVNFLQLITGLLLQHTSLMSIPQKISRCNHNGEAMA